MEVHEIKLKTLKLIWFDILFLDNHKIQTFKKKPLSATEVSMKVHVLGPFYVELNYSVLKTSIQILPHLQINLTKI